MKNILLILPLVFFISCNNSEESTPTTDSTTPEVSTKTDTATSPKTAPKSTPKTAPKTSPKSDILKQQGSYAALFNREPKNCDFVTREILAEALQTPLATIVQGDNGCTFHFEEPDGNSTRFFFVVEKWKNKQILKDIAEAKKNAKMFGENSRLSQYKISETGDTYLSMHQNRMVRILNETSDTAIVVLYFPKTDPEDSDYEKKNLLKDKARERSYAIANSLLKKHQE